MNADAPLVSVNGFTLPERYLYWMDRKYSDPLLSLIDVFFNQFDSSIILSNLLKDDRIKPLIHAREVLGSTLATVMLDCRDGFPLDLFLSVTNAIGAGSHIILLLDFDFSLNNESQRFHVKPIKTDSFNQLLIDGLNQYAIKIDSVEEIPSLKQNMNANDKELTAEQKRIKDDFLALESGISTLFSSRGSGKSYLTAQIMAVASEAMVLTAPNQRAIFEYLQHKKTFLFRAPDDLFLNGSIEEFKGKTLIVEEAAKIPLAHLEKLCGLFNKILLVSSVENYEGTRQGLREKIYDLVTITQAYHLEKIIRFDSEDSIAKFTALITLDASIHFISSNQVLEQCNHNIKIFSDQKLDQFQRDRSLVQQFYQLLNQTHYQTNVQDIRRLMDGDRQVILTKHNDKEDLIGAIWGLEEGELSEELAFDVFRGLRRPKGNLVPQTLSAHSYYPEAMKMSSVRVSRISVKESERFKGIASQMLQTLIDNYRESKDFISVSFGLTAPLLMFWEKCGFYWIHIGTHRDKTTGLHAAVMIYPLSQQAKDWLITVKEKWLADIVYLKKASFIRPSSCKLFPEGKVGRFDYLDRRSIEAYEQYRKPKLAVYAALKRQEKNNY